MERFWDKPEWAANDHDLMQLAAMPFQRAFPALQLDKGLYIIRGPRQVGKTSWLKTLLNSAVKSHGAKACFFLSCENITDRRELVEVLRSISHHAFVFLDEITFVEGWSRAVKHEIDRGGTACLVLTGSNAADLRRGGDWMPGRFGKGRELHLLPMTFAEFQAMRRQAKWPRLNDVEELELFFRIGGFPLALAESGPKGARPAQAMDTYKRWLVGDLLKLGKQEVYLQELLLQLALTLGTPISLQTLARKTQMGSHHTAQSYIEILQDCFALRTLYAIDPNSGGLRFRKDKKFYFSDPLLFWIALDWAGIKVPKKAAEQMAELVAHESLIREHKRFGFYHSAKGEIDFYKKDAWALEVKWAEIPQNLSKAYLDLVIPWKSIWVKNNFLKVQPPLL